jgi:hypothetical protein
VQQAIAIASANYGRTPANQSLKNSIKIPSQNDAGGFRKCLIRTLCQAGVQIILGKLRG